jgi:hypothetical protein
VVAICRAILERSAEGDCYLPRAENGGAPMRRLPGNPDRDVSAKPNDRGIDANIAALFASRPPTVDEFFADPIVQMRIGMLITQAVNKPTGPRR